MRPVLIFCSVVFAWVIPRALPMECFACETNLQNNVTCEDSLVVTNCEHHPEGSRLDSCYTFTFTFNNVTEVHKNCSIQSRCPELEQIVCSSLEGSGATLCELECCEGERCNHTPKVGDTPKIGALRSKASMLKEYGSVVVVSLLVSSHWYAFV